MGIVQLLNTIKFQFDIKIRIQDNQNKEKS